MTIALPAIWYHGLAVLVGAVPLIRVNLRSRQAARALPAAAAEVTATA